MPEINEWLGKWEPPFAGKHERIQLVPAIYARGYKWNPMAVWPTLARPRAKADFSQAPQLNWWLDEKKRSRRDGAIARGIKRVLRSINV